MIKKNKTHSWGDQIVSIQDKSRRMYSNENSRTFFSKFKIHIGIDEIVVCKKPFGSLFGVGKNVIGRICNKLKQNITSPKEERGKHLICPNKIPENI